MIPARYKSTKNASVMDAFFVAIHKVQDYILPIMIKNRNLNR